MLWSMEHLRGYSVRATDDSLGSVRDLLFDDNEWIARYLVIDTSRWLLGRRVLIPPSALGHPDREARAFPVALTKRQVKDSPSIDSDRPVSRQYESELHAYYGWAPYWGAPAMMAGVPPTTAGTMAAGMTGAREPAASVRDEPAGDPHLRSAHEVHGYYIHAADGDIGHISDFLVDEAGWTIRYVVADTRNWLPGKKVLLAPSWITAISWAETMVRVDLTREQIKNSPEYDPDRTIERSYEERLHHHYDRIPYW